MLALQEVDRNQPRSEHADLTAVAAEAMGARRPAVRRRAVSGAPGATWVAATGEEQPDAAAYGIALLSRYPVLSWQVVRLPVLPTRVPMRFRGDRLPTLVRDEPRVAVAALVETPRGPVTVVTTHLSFVDLVERPAAAQPARGTLPGDGPLLLTGDLNMEPDRRRAVSGLRPLARR